MDTHRKPFSAQHPQGFVFQVEPSENFGLEGGWIPLMFGVLVFIIMTTWHFGVEALHRRNAERSHQPGEFFASLRKDNIIRVPGTAVFLTRLGDAIPPIIFNYVKQGRSLHETAIALTVNFE